MLVAVFVFGVQSNYNIIVYNHHFLIDRRYFNRVLNVIKLLGYNIPLATSRPTMLRYRRREYCVRRRWAYEGGAVIAL